MRQLSLCIFEVDPGDDRRLTEAKRSQLEGKHGMVGLTDAEVIQKITRDEWRLHCRRRTRGAEETALLIQDLLQTFGGTAGRDNLDIPLLDPLRIQDIWSTQRPHLSCIQDIWSTQRPHLISPLVQWLEPHHPESSRALCTWTKW
ncbi:hypothetical protein KUCAC02_031453 [Chaenocephalus aceratus]|nr:hypothetical protein KUCAC02_031453 [Chaenocephalus aceratus]